MYVCICLVARINQRVFRNSSLQMFSMGVHGKGCRSRLAKRPAASRRRLVINKNIPSIRLFMRLRKLCDFVVLTKKFFAK